MTLAIYDLDETLLAGDSCTLFCEYLVEIGLADDDFIQRDAQMMTRYEEQTLDLNDYIRFLVEPVLQLKTTDIDLLMPRFLDQYIVPNLYPEAIQMLMQHKQQGLRQVIISATAEFIVNAIAKQLGIDDVLAIQLHVNNQRYTGEVSGIPTFREGKVERLMNWMAEQRETLEGALFYSDSINDLPLLEKIEFPIATNPDQPLIEIAIKRNWPVVQWTAPNVNDVQ